MGQGVGILLISSTRHRHRIAVWFAHVLWLAVTKQKLRYEFAPHSAIGQVKQFDDCLFLILAGNLEGARKNIYDMLPILPLKRPFWVPCWVVISFSCLIEDPCDKVKMGLARMHVMSWRLEFGDKQIPAWKKPVVLGDTEEEKTWR